MVQLKLSLILVSTIAHFHCSTAAVTSHIYVCIRANPERHLNDTCVSCTPHCPEVDTVEWLREKCEVALLDCQYLCKSGDDFAYQDDLVFLESECHYSILLYGTINPSTELPTTSIKNGRRNDWKPYGEIAIIFLSSTIFIIIVAALATFGIKKAKEESVKDKTGQAYVQNGNIGRLRVRPGPNRARQGKRVSTKKQISAKVTEHHELAPEGSQNESVWVRREDLQMAKEPECENISTTSALEKPNSLYDTNQEESSSYKKVQSVSEYQTCGKERDIEAVWSSSRNEEHKTENWGSKESSNKERLDLLRQRFRNILYAKSKEEQLDTMFTTPDFSIGIFDHNGGYLEIPDTSVHLYIPPGALPHGSMQEIYIYLFNHSSDLAEDNITSPIIRCGPPGLQFQECIFGVVLSFLSDHNNAQFNVFTKESEEDIARGWLNLSEQAPERCFTDGDGNVHLMLNHFSDFKTEKVPTNAVSNENGLKLSAFGKPFQPGECTFDLYVCMWNPSYQKKVDAEAARLGYFPLQDGDQLLNVKNDESVKVKLSDLKMGWQLIYPDDIEQTIQASEDHCANCKCHFNMEHIAGSPGRTGGLHCRIIAYTDSQKVKLPIRVSERWKCDSRVLFGDEETKSDLACAPSNMVREDASPEELFGETFFGEISRKISNHLSARAYYELCLELNAKRTPPTDWRLLMAELGLEEMKYIHQIEEGKEEGAVVVVNLFFSRNKGKVALQKLHEACKKVKLYRAVQILENDQECLRTNNANAQAIQLHYQNEAHPDDQHCPLPDVTQPTALDSLSHMMSQMMQRQQRLDASPKGVIATMQQNTSVCFGSQNLYPKQTWV